MPTVRDILAHKSDTTVHSIAAASSCLDAVKKMSQLRIGSLVVTGPDGALVGIVTERDILWHVVAHPADVAVVPVSDVMTRDVVVCTPEDDLNAIRSIIRSRYVRQVPVVSEDGNLLGIISIGDVNAFQITESETTIRFMTDYVRGDVR
ncbi:MAG: CBS domain-containing protein [Planctomycetes bacterium]|nr:CBS domain-containing protein [Planctomycetota bacterium]